MLKKVLLSLGSNLGDRSLYIKKAMDELATLSELKILSRSSVMETSPIGVTGQQNYLNAVLFVETTMEPLRLLKELKAIEQRLGRKFRVRWAEREIDIDILIYEGVTLKVPELCLPHKEFTNRLFALKGAAELWPEGVIGEYNSTVKSLYLSRKEELCKDQIVLDTKW